MNNYITLIGSLTDKAFAPYRTVMASWTTYIADLRALLPPATPPKPTVGAPPPGGTATPSGDWHSGQQVRYALMARSSWNPSVQSELEERLRKSGFKISEEQSTNKGPSASEWSEPLTIGPTVGAVVGGITDVDGADTLVVLRQFSTNTAAAWSDSQQVAALARPFPPTYTDTNPGGNPW
jgi:hypothetical protein